MATPASCAYPAAESEHDAGSAVAAAVGPRYRHRLRRRPWHWLGSCSCHWSALQWLLAWQQIVEINEAHWAKSAKVFYNFSSLCSRQLLLVPRSILFSSSFCSLFVVIHVLTAIFKLFYELVLLLALRHFRISANA